MFIFIIWVLNIKFWEWKDDIMNGVLREGFCCYYFRGDFRICIVFYNKLNIVYFKYRNGIMK